MINLLRGRGREPASEAVESQEIDELHFLSEQVYFRRTAENWTQDELAEVSGMTQAQIANIEAARANPTVRSLVKVAHALRCRVSDLFQLPRYEVVKYAPAARWTKETLELPSFNDLLLTFEDEGIPIRVSDRRPPDVERSCRAFHNRTGWLQQPYQVHVAIWTVDGEARLVDAKSG